MFIPPMQAKDHAKLHKRDEGARDQLIVRRLNRVFGSVVLHEITAHRIEQWKRDRLNALNRPRQASTRAASSSAFTNPRTDQPYTTVALERYTHPLQTLKVNALEAWAFLVTNWSQQNAAGAARARNAKCTIC